MRGLPYSESHSLVKVTKPQARKLFAMGKDINLQSSKMPVYSMWQKPYLLRYVTYFEEAGSGMTAEAYFDKVVSDYCYYNCDKDRGKYVSYYVDYRDIKGLQSSAWSLRKFV